MKHWDYTVVTRQISKRTKFEVNVEFLNSLAFVVIPYILW